MAVVANLMGLKIVLIFITVCYVDIFNINIPNVTDFEIDNTRNPS